MKTDIVTYDVAIIIHELPRAVTWCNPVKVNEIADEDECVYPDTNKEPNSIHFWQKLAYSVSKKAFITITLDIGLISLRTRQINDVNFRAVRGQVTCPLRTDQVKVTA